MNKKAAQLIRSSAAEYLTFIATTGGSGGAIEIRYEDENIWLTQKMMAELYFEKYRIVQDKLFQSDFDRFLELAEGADKLK